MNHRLTFAAGFATAASSLSLFAVLHGSSWLVAGIGAIAVVGLAGTLTRLATIPSAIAAAVAVLIASVPLLVGYGWAGRVGALVLVAMAALSATGNRSARSFAVLATYVSCLLIYLNAAFASAASYIWLIPSVRSASVLTHLPGKAYFGYQPPVPATRPLDFITVAGIGGVAIIVDFVAVRLRRPALAGLPLLTLFSVPVATNLKTFTLNQTLTFAAALAAYLALLSADGRQRLRMWGRLVTVRRMPTADEAGAGPDTRDVAATGRRIGLAAVCLAIVVPLALPSGKPHDIFGKTRTGNGSGGGQSNSTGGLSPLLTVLPDLTKRTPTPVLSYTTSAKNPQQQYLLEYVMNYNAASNDWLAVSATHNQIQGSQLTAQIPGLELGLPVTTVTTKLKIIQQEQGPLPLPYAPVKITGADKQLSEDSSLMVYDSDTQANLSLTVTSHEPAPSQADLIDTESNAIPPIILNTYASYRGPDATQLKTIAKKQISANAGALQEADELQSWFTSGAFVYSLKTGLPSDKGWLLKFLTTDRHGFCLQFAWAFAVLARLLGIPARIAEGFTAGSQPVPGGPWQVTTADAHAWPELYFQSIGWVRFEPTPAGPTGQGTAEVPPYAVSTPSGLVTPTPGVSPTAPTSTPSTSTTGKTHNGKLGGIAGANGGGGGGGSNGHGFPVGITVGLALLLLLASPALGRWLTRRRRWIAASGDAALAHAAWRELLDYLTDYGIPSLPSESPRATVKRVSEAAGLAPATREAIARIGSAEERARYSLSTQPGGSLPADVATTRKAIAASTTRGQRLRALLLPPSTLAAVAAGIQSLSRATSWIDASWPSMRRQLRRAVARRA